MIKNIWSKIAYFWFLGMLIIVGFFSGNLKVDAATIGYSYFDYRFGQYSCSVNGTNCIIISNGSFVSMSTYVNVNAQYGNQFGRFNFRIGTNDTYISGNTYKFRITLQMDDKETVVNNLSKINGSIYLEPLYASTSSNGSNASQTNYEFSVRFVDSSSTTDKIYLDISVSPESNAKWFGFSFLVGQPTTTTDKIYFRGITKLRALNLYTSYTEGIGAQIDNQTNVINQQTNIINNSVNDVNDSINNDNIDNPSSSITNFQSMLPSNGTITNLIALPITLYQKILNSINGTCSQFNLGSLYGTNLIIPCIDIDDYLGSTIWNTIDIIISGTFIFVIARKMIKAFNNFTSMKEGDVIND